MLLKDAAKALEAARAFAQHLASTAPQRRTKFETCIAEDPRLMQELNTFIATAPPVLLWKGGGQFAYLFKFLAARFLANPDSVLDDERQHAIWQ